MEYIAYGNSPHNQWASAHVPFTTTRLSRLRPGQELYQRYDETTDDRNVVVPEAQFRTDTCSEQ